MSIFKISKFKRIAVILLGGRFLHILSVTLILISGCNTSKNGLIGSWIQQVPGQTDRVQGIRIEAVGKASSINMQTLQYETWEQQGSRIILQGKSIGNGQTLSFSDTLEIEKLTADTMILRKRNFRRTYNRTN